jgi:AcrR family transcriptional regulator
LDKLGKLDPLDRSRPRRRDLAVARTREDILMATCRCLVRGGLGAVSMQEIAAEVGFTAPALYAYFDSKEAIFRELFLGFRRELIETFETQPTVGRRSRAEVPFRQRLAALVRRQLEWMDRRRDVMVAIFALKTRSETVVDRQPSGKRHEPLPLAHMRLLTTWLGRWSGPSDLVGHSPTMGASVLFGIVQGFVFPWIKSPTPGHRLSDETDHIVDLFLHGVMGARAAANIQQ